MLPFGAIEPFENHFDKIKHCNEGQYGVTYQSKAKLDGMHAILSKMYFVE